MAQWYGNASPEVRMAINQAFYNKGKLPPKKQKVEKYRSDKYIYYTDGSKERW